jgi:hypothetical protein
LLAPFCAKQASRNSANRGLPIAKTFIGVKPPAHSEEVLQALAELQKK